MPPLLWHVLGWRRGARGLEQHQVRARSRTPKGVQHHPPLGRRERGRTGMGSRVHTGAHTGTHTGVCTGAAGGRASRGGSDDQAGHGKIEFPHYFQTSSLDSLPWQWFSCNGFSHRDGPGSGMADVPPPPSAPTSPRLLPGQGRGRREVGADPRGSGPSRRHPPQTYDRQPGATMARPAATLTGPRAPDRKARAIPQEPCRGPAACAPHRSLPDTSPLLASPSPPIRGSRSPAPPSPGLGTTFPGTSLERAQSGFGLYRARLEPAARCCQARAHGGCAPGAADSQGITLPQPGPVRLRGPTGAQRDLGALATTASPGV